MCERAARVIAALGRCAAARYAPPAVLPAGADVPPGTWTTWPLVGDPVLCVVLGARARARAPTYPRSSVRSGHAHGVLRAQLPGRRRAGRVRASARLCLWPTRARAAGRRACTGRAHARVPGRGVGCACACARISRQAAGVLCDAGNQQCVFVAEDCLLMRVSVAARDVVERLKILGMRPRALARAGGRARTRQRAHPAAALFEALDGRRPAALQCDPSSGAPPPLYKRHMAPGQCGAVGRALPPALRALPVRPGVAVVRGGTNQ